MRDRDLRGSGQPHRPILVAGTPRFTGWCLEPHDLCVAKLVALREKDANFVASLLAAGLVDPTVIAARRSRPLVGAMEKSPVVAK